MQPKDVIITYRDKEVDLTTYICPKCGFGIYRFWSGVFSKYVYFCGCGSFVTGDPEELKELGEN